MRRSASPSWLLLALVAGLVVALGLVACTPIGDDLRPRPADAPPPDAFVLGPDARALAPDARTTEARGPDAPPLADATQPGESPGVSSPCGKTTAGGEETRRCGHPPRTP